MFTVLCSLSLAGSMRYLTQQEFGQYDELLQKKGRSDLKTTVAVYDDSFTPPRIGLKCINKKGEQFQVYIIGENITKIVKINNR